MSDDLGLFTDTRSTGRRTEREERRRRLRRRRRVALGVLFALLVLISVGVWYGARQVLELWEVPDYTGTGTGRVVVQVEQGDTTSAIAGRMASEGVVKSARAFTLAAEDVEGIRGVQPGYYLMRNRMSGAAAVSRLLDPASRVGQFSVRAGLQLDDVVLPDGTVTPGILSRFSEASCVRPDGSGTCISSEQLRQAMAGIEPSELGVPDWAVQAVSRAPPTKRLEGLIMPGNYHVRPGSTAVELLRQVMATSTTRLQSAGMPTEAGATGFDPYQVLTIASTIEKEAITSDFGTVSRVIYNRLAQGIPLQMDSTINYPLDRQRITTSDADRGAPGPYNTYLNLGLPPTPIGTPSSEALEAAMNPDPGPWRYFVKCRTDGTSCFSVTIEEHRAKVADARARGVF